tara:strand:+ start:190 stop:456 length:267 start_codon:yes stop_codon:yes gene_type:complete
MADLDMLTDYYFLLYKLKNSKILWIVRISDYIDELEEHIKNFISNIEKYYIVLSSVHPSILSINKSFVQFEPDETTLVISETNYNINY